MKLSKSLDELRDSLLGFHDDLNSFLAARKKNRESSVHKDPDGVSYLCSNCRKPLRGGTGLPSGSLDFLPASGEGTREPPRGGTGSSSGLLGSVEGTSLNGNRSSTSSVPVRRFDAAEGLVKFPDLKKVPEETERESRSSSLEYGFPDDQEQLTRPLKSFLQVVDVEGAHDLSLKALFVKFFREQFELSTFGTDDFEILWVDQADEDSSLVATCYTLPANTSHGLAGQTRYQDFRLMRSSTGFSVEPFATDGVVSFAC